MEGVIILWGKVFSKDKNNGYVSPEFYESEINRIDEEIKSIDKTIKFYETKRRALEDWRSVVKLSIKKSNEKEICKNCKYFSRDTSCFCSLFSSCVEKEATCPEFVWDV